MPTKSTTRGRLTQLTRHILHCHQPTGSAEGPSSAESLTLLSGLDAASAHYEGVARCMGSPIFNPGWDADPAALKAAWDRDGFMAFPGIMTPKATADCLASLQRLQRRSDHIIMDTDWYVRRAWRAVAST